MTFQATFTDTESLEKRIRVYELDSLAECVELVTRIAERMQQLVSIREGN